MGITMLVATTDPLDDFLAGAGAGTDTAETLQRFGLLLSLTGVALAAGMLAFLALTLRGSQSEVRDLVRVAGTGGVMMLIGGSLEIAATASLFDVSWSDAITGSDGPAGMMRLLAGLLVVLGLFDTTEPAGSDGAGADVVRWVPTSASAFGVAGAVIGVLSFGFDGHTATEGPRIVHAVVNAVHVAAGSVWFGGLVGLVIVGLLRRGSSSGAAPLVVRFSSVATVALAAVLVAGVAMAVMILGSPGELTSTTWGRLLIVKSAAVGVAILIGGYNHFSVVPALERDTHEAPTRARRTVTVEAALLTGVVLLTTWLTTASTI